MKNGVLSKTIVVVTIFLLFSVIVTPIITCARFVDDTTPPITTHTLDPPTPDGENGWYVSDVTVTLNATDDMSGVKKIYYKIKGYEWKNQTGDSIIFVLDDDCLDGFIDFYSVDNAGNLEEIKSVKIAIDQLPPEIKVECEKQKENNSLIYTFYTWAEDYCSGVCYLMFFLNDVFQALITGPGPEYVWQFKYNGELKIKITIEVYDCAGNFASYDKQINYRTNSYQQSIYPFFLHTLERFPLLKTLLFRLRLL